MRKSMSIQFRSYDMIERFSKEIAEIKGEFDLVSGKKDSGCKIISWNFQSGSLRSACAACSNR